MKKIFLFIVLSVLCFSTCSTPLFAQEKSGSSVENIKPDKSAEQLDFANGLFQRELYEMAVDEYQKITKDVSVTAQVKEEALFGIAESYFFMNDYDRAASAYDTFLKNYAGTDRAFITDLRRGQIFFYKEKYKDSIQQLDAVNEERLPRLFLQVLYRYKAKAYRALNESDKALEFFEKAARTSQDNTQTVEAYHELARMYKNSQELKIAAEFYQKAYQRAETDQLKSISLYNKGEILFQQKLFSEAAEAFREVLDRFAETEVAPDAAANLILAFYNLSKFEEAVDVFQKYLSQRKKEAEYLNMYYVLAAAYGQLERVKEAETFIDDVLALDSLKNEDRQKMLLKKSEILAKSNDFNSAVQLVDQALGTSEEKKDRALFIKAESLYGLKQYEQAFQLYQQIVDQYGDSEVYDDALYALGHALSATGKDQQAMEAFWQYVDKGQNNDHRRDALYNEILLAKKLKEYERAAGHGERLLADYPDKDSKQTQSIMFLLGTVYPKLEQYQKAVDIFKTYASHYPDSEQIQDVYFLIGYNLQLAGQSSEAVAYYDKVTLQEQRKDLYYSALKNKGLLYINNGEEQKATDVFEQMIRDFPDNDLDLNTYLWLARYFQDKQQYDKVLNILENAAGKKTAQEFQDAIAYYRAEAFKAKKEWAEAVKAFDQVISFKPESRYKAAARIGKGESLLALDKPKPARDEFDTVLLEFPQDHTVTIRARYAIATLEQNRGNLEEASKFFMLVAVLYDDNEYCPKSLFYAGEMMTELKKNKEGLKLFQELIDRYPDHPLAAKARERLGN